MNFTWLYLCSLLCIAAVEYHGVNGLAFDYLDFARSTIEAAAKNITTKPPTKYVTLYTQNISDFLKSMSVITPLNDGPHRLPGTDGIPSDRIMLRFSKSGNVEVGYKTVSKKPRNLNKFSEAMDQIERAMTQAELSRKPMNLTDLRKDIRNAVNRGNIR